MEFDELSNRVIGCAIEVHRELGPGLLESTYEQCFAHELNLGESSVLSYDSFVLFVSFVVFSCYWRVDPLTLDDVFDCERLLRSWANGCSREE